MIVEKSYNLWSHYFKNVLIMCSFRTYINKLFKKIYVRFFNLYKMYLKIDG